MAEAVILKRSNQQEFQTSVKETRYAKIITNTQPLRKNSLQVLLNTTKNNTQNTQSLINPKYNSADKDYQNTISANKKIQIITNNRKRKSHITDTLHLQQQYKAKINNKPVNILEEQTTSKLKSHINHERYRTQSLLTSSKKQIDFAKQNILNRPHKLIQMKDSYFEEWINGVIMQHCSEQQFNLDLNQAGLKKYNIDKNSLISLGVSPDNASRILKSLYVYSMGFNNTLKEMIGGNNRIKLIIWRVFMILIEYCSDGNLKTMLSELQKQKQQKISSLLAQISQYQAILQYGNDKQEQKNNKIRNQIKSLRYQNQQLQLESSLLKDDKMNQQRVINEQVSLRIMFETKINDIHRLYRELSLKHETLLNQYEQSYTNNRKGQLLIQKLQNDIIMLKQQIVKLKQKENDHILQIQINKNQLLKTNQETISTLTYSFKLRTQLAKLKQYIKQKEIIYNEMAANDSHLRSHIKTLEQEYHKIQNGYLLQLSINTDNHQKYDAQLTEINNFIDYKDYRTKNKPQLIKELEYLCYKIQKTQEQIIKLQQTYKELNQKYTLLKQKNELIILQSKNFKQNLQLNYKAIQDLKGVNNQSQRLLQQEQHKTSILGKQLKIKQNLMQNYESQIRQFKEKELQWQKQNRQLANKCKYYQKQIDYNTSLYKKQLESIQKKINVERDHYENTCKQFKMKQTQFYKTRQNFHELQLNIKNLVFQRQNLQILYRHTLSVIQSLQDVNKQINQANSTLETSLQDEKLKFKRLQVLFEKNKNNYESNISELSKRLKLLQDKRNRDDYIHPMVHQDVIQQYHRLNEKLLKFQIKMIDQTQTLGYIIKQIQERMIQSAKQKIKIQQQYAQKQQKNNQQVEYYKYRTEEHRKKLSEAQQQLNFQIQQKKSYIYQNQILRQQLKVDLQQEKDYLRQKVQNLTDENNSIIKQLEKAHSSFNLFIHQIEKHMPNNKRVQEIKNSIYNSKYNKYIPNFINELPEEEQNDFMRIKITQIQDTKHDSSSQNFVRTGEIRSYKISQAISIPSMNLQKKKSTQVPSTLSPHKPIKQEQSHHYKFPQRQVAFPTRKTNFNAYKVEKNMPNKSKLKRLKTYAGQNTKEQQKNEISSEMKDSQIRRSYYEQDAQQIEASIKQRNEMKARIKHTLIYYSDNRMKQI